MLNDYLAVFTRVATEMEFSPVKDTSIGTRKSLAVKVKTQYQLYYYSPLQRGEVPLYSSLRRYATIPVTLHRWQHQGGSVK